MQLPFLKKTGESERNFFLSLLIKPFKVGAILFEEIEGRLAILATHEAALEKDVNDLTAEELLIAADRAISSVEPSLPEGGSVEKTVFSIPASWVDEGKITSDNLSKLKKMCEDLGLVPMGYLMSIEAIVHFIQRNEGAPISAVFVETAGEKVFVYLVKGGKIVEFKEEVVGEGIISTVEEVLRSFSAEVLPSKIILLDHKESSATQQKFLSHSWPEDIPFLHLPQVMTLEAGLENEATINGVASQMELKVEHDPQVIQSKDPEDESIDDDNAGDDFGFLKEKDIREESYKEDAEVKSNVEEPHDNLTEVDENAFGGFKKEDETHHELLQEEESSSQEGDKKRSVSPLLALAATAKLIKIPKLPVGLASIGGGALKIRLIAGAIAVIVIAFLLSYAYYNYLLKAEITVFADQKTIDDEFDVVFATDGGEDTIKIELITEEINGDATKKATGVLETGEKAKGAITIFNKTESPKTFEKGTVIIGPNDLEFVLTEEIKVASTSAFSTSLSSAEGDVEAAEFGTEYNLPSNSNFTIEGSSSSLFIGKNSNAITGGTREEKTVVAEKDLDDLAAAVVEELEVDALSKAREKLGDGEVILSEAISSEVAEQEYSQKAGDEAGEVGITATVNYNIGKYRNEDLAAYLMSVADEDIPGNYSYSANNSSIDVAELDIDDEESIAAKLTVSAVFVPKIEAGDIGGKISGKSVSYAEEEIKKVDGVTDVVINLKNVLPFLPKLIPNNTKNISIVFKNES